MSNIEQGSGGRVLVLGASGGIGGEVARQLRDAGWEVVALRRRAAPRAGDGFSWQIGDAMSREDVVRAAQGCSVIVHAVNPPGYRNWAQLVMPMLENTLAAARAVGATVVLPGTVYNFGPDAFPVLHEDSPQRPRTRKGAIRVAMERALESATTENVRVIIVRAGDFFGSDARNNWFSLGLVKPGQPVRTVQLPGAPGVGHAWAYLPDVAATLVQLITRRKELPAFARFHMAGHWDADGRQIGAAIGRVVARRGGSVRIKAFPWWLMRLVAPFMTTPRELMEMRYLWRTPVSMSNARLTAMLGAEPHTDLDAAVETTLIGIGCLPGPAENEATRREAAAPHAAR